MHNMFINGYRMFFDKSLLHKAAGVCCTFTLTRRNEYNNYLAERFHLDAFSRVPEYKFNSILAIAAGESVEGRLATALGDLVSFVLKGAR